MPIRRLGAFGSSAAVVEDRRRIDFRFVLDLERTWFRLGAKGDSGAVDHAPETSIIGRAQTVF
jgi:hypothetical protein